MQQIKLKLLHLDYLLGAAIIMFQALGMNSLVSLLFYGTFFITLFLWASGCVQSVDRMDLLVLLIVAVAFIHVGLNAISAGAHLSFGYLKKYIMFSCTILFFAAARKLTIGSAEYKWMKRIYVLTGVLLIGMYVWRPVQMHLLNGIVTNYLTFGFTNPNFTAMFLTCLTIFLVVIWVGAEKKWMKIGYFLLVAVMIYFVIGTKARNAMLAVASFLVLFFWTSRRKKVFQFSNRLLRFWAVMPIVFACAYLVMIETLEDMGAFSFLVQEGKALSSRVRVWSEALKAFAQSPIFGAYCQVSNGSGMSQLHNTHVDVLSSYGISVLVLLCIFLYELMKKMRDQCQSWFQCVALVGFMCVLMLGLGEAALFSGGLAIYLHFGIFILLNNTNGEI